MKKNAYTRGRIASRRSARARRRPARSSPPRPRASYIARHDEQKIDVSVHVGRQQSGAHRRVRRHDPQLIGATGRQRRQIRRREDQPARSAPEARARAWARRRPASSTPDASSSATTSVRATPDPGDSSERSRCPCRGDQRCSSEPCPDADPSRPERRACRREPANRQDWGGGLRLPSHPAPGAARAAARGAPQARNVRRPAARRRRPAPRRQRPRRQRADSRAGTRTPATCALNSAYSAGDSVPRT